MLRHKHPLSFSLGLTMLIALATQTSAAEIVGNKVQWQPLTVIVNGPKTSEDATPNPFTDMRLDIEFQSGDHSLLVPGYYAADGDAAETSASSGNVWKAHFTPPAAGKWTATIHFKQGKMIAIDDSSSSGSPIKGDGETLTIDVAAADPSAPHTLGMGKLQTTGGRYLRYGNSDIMYLKAGADSPENLLGYVDFDQTTKEPKKNKDGKLVKGGELHTFKPHLSDWKSGDPTWKDGKGKGLIGSINYLASKGVNSIYFLTMNITGDGNDVWPYTSFDERMRFDCSKLDQWNLVFDHMDHKGVALHVVTQEQENDQLLDDGDLGPTRKLYYRELIARFAHHGGVVWNLGEENTNTTAQVEDFCKYIKAVDPYDNAIVIHTFPDKRDDVYTPLLGFKDLDGASLQFKGDWENINKETTHWLEESAKANREWMVNLDELGPAALGMDPDNKPNHKQNEALRGALWGNLFAGGGGAEWYFGYKNDHNDLDLEDFRSRDHVWDRTKIAIDFFQDHLPFQTMSAQQKLIASGNGFCMAKTGDVYAVYQFQGESVVLDLSSAAGEYTVHWFDPVHGGKLQNGTLSTVSGSAQTNLGQPENDHDHDWIAVLKKK